MSQCAKTALAKRLLSNSILTNTHMKIKNGKLSTGTISKKFATTLGLAATLILSSHHANAVLTVNLNTAGSFAALAGAGITFAAPVNSTVIHGDIGSFDTTTITGLENAVIHGVNHAGDSVTQQSEDRSLCCLQ